MLLHQSPLHKSTLHTSPLHLHCYLPLASSPWQQPTRLMGRVVLSVVISQTGENAQRFLTCFEVRQFLAAAQLVSWLAKCSFSRLTTVCVYVCVCYRYGFIKLPSPLRCSRFALLLLLGLHRSHRSWSRALPSGHGVSRALIQKRAELRHRRFHQSVHHCRHLILKGLQAEHACE